MTGTYNKTKEAAINALIEWVQTGMGELTMRDAVNDYLESCGANLPSIGGEETVLARRKMAVNRLLIDCLYALSKDEIDKVERELESIVAAGFTPK